MTDRLLLLVQLGAAGSITQCTKTDIPFLVPELHSFKGVVKPHDIHATPHSTVGSTYLWAHTASFTLQSRPCLCIVTSTPSTPTTSTPIQSVCVVSPACTGTHVETRSSTRLTCMSLTCMYWSSYEDQVQCLVTIDLPKPLIDAKMAGVKLVSRPSDFQQKPETEGSHAPQ